MCVLTVLSGVSVCINANDLHDFDIHKGADVFLPVLGELSLVDFNFPGGCVCVCTVRQLCDVAYRPDSLF
jgi:hypothetical protein